MTAPAEVTTPAERGPTRPPEDVKEDGVLANRVHVIGRSPEMMEANFTCLTMSLTHVNAPSANGDEDERATDEEEEEQATDEEDELAIGEEEGLTP